MQKLYMRDVLEHLKNGYISRRYNAAGALSILNYTDKCTYDSKWDAWTKMCRGLIINEDNYVVAKCFPKFFNLGEKEECKLRNLPKTGFEVFEKIDGSYGQTYWENGELKISTRGSFDGPQATWATNFIKTKDSSKFNPDYTYIFEIVYKENRIITDYKDFEGLTLLAIYDLNTWKELDRSVVVQEACTIGIPPVECKYYLYIEDILKDNAACETLDEGFVVRFKNGYRVKMKNTKYLQVSKIVKNMTPLSVWEHMEKGKVKLDFVEAVPEELLPDLMKIVGDMEAIYEIKFMTYDFMYKQCVEWIDEEVNFYGLVIENDTQYKKLLVQKIKDNYPKYTFIINFYGGGSIDKSIMKELRPVGNVIKNDGDSQKVVNVRSVTKVHI